MSHVSVIDVAHPTYQLQRVLFATYYGERSENRLSVIKSLLEQGADASFSESHALLVTLSRWSSDRSGGPDGLRAELLTLVNAGADINARSGAALRFCAYLLDPEMLPVLLQIGANPNNILQEMNSIIDDRDLRGVRVMSGIMNAGSFSAAGRDLAAHKQMFRAILDSASALSSLQRQATFSEAPAQSNEAAPQAPQTLHPWHLLTPTGGNPTASPDPIRVLEHIRRCFKGFVGGGLEGLPRFAPSVAGLGTVSLKCESTQTQTNFGPLYQTPSVLEEETQRETFGYGDMRLGFAAVDVEGALVPPHLAAAMSGRIWHMEDGDSVDKISSICTLHVSVVHRDNVPLLDAAREQHFEISRIDSALGRAKEAASIIQSLSEGDAALLSQYEAFNVQFNDSPTVRKVLDLMAPFNQSNFRPPDLAGRPGRKP